MNKLNLLALAAFLTGFVSIGSSDKENVPLDLTKGRSLPAITKKSAALPIDQIKLPAGFSISLYAEVQGARSMVMSPAGTLFVGTQRSGNVYAV